MKYSTHKTTRKAIDKRLEEINSIQSTLGIDSTKSEIREAKREQQLLWKQIESFDPEFYDTYYKTVKDE